MAKTKKKEEKKEKVEFTPDRVIRHRVKKGKSVMGIGGLFDGDDPQKCKVNADNVGGQETLDLLIEKGIVEEFK